ncbi:rod shape-determining protein MreC [bacterium]|jgi:rod shape-determining protein MreC|nr:rod shape-determining protein MreC [bacterium]MBT4648709.1 rod shape-determining protein MreC [bacterium]
MLRRNLQIFLLFLAASLLLIFFKEGQIFDFGFVMRQLPAPQKVANQLLNPPDDLAESYKELLVENSQLQLLEEENKKLRELLDFTQTTEHDLVVANVVSRDFINQNLLIIDVGNAENIGIGQAVVVNNGIVIGKIIDVMQDAAVVRLLTDNGSKLAVSLGDQTLISGLLSGSLGLGMSLQYIPQDTELKKGDILFTSDLNELIPGGLVVGQVEEVEFSEGELFKKASISPLVDYNTLSLLSVIVSL